MGVVWVGVVLGAALSGRSQISPTSFSFYIAPSR